MTAAPPMRVLVTGAGGKLGRRIIAALLANGNTVHAASRGPIGDFPANVPTFAVGRIDAGTQWENALAGVTHVVHGAALTALTSGSADSFLSVNAEGTERLASEAARCGVKRFVQISSASINGRVSGNRPISTSDIPRPISDYSWSKLIAERVLFAISAQTGLEAVAIRPPRLIGDQLTGNLRLFERLIVRGLPLPFGLIDHNARDSVSVENLVSLILVALVHPDAKGHVFFATDGRALSTRALVESIARRNNRKPRFLPVPPAMVRGLVAGLPAAMLGNLRKDELASELLDDFRLDIEPAKAILGWSPDVPA
jgi:nucleoside-diphosphate-sugar epimerase